MKKVLAIAVSLVFVVTLFAGCGGGGATSSTAPASAAPAESSAPAAAEPAASAAPESSTFKIAIMPKLVGIPYFNATEEGAKKAGADLGVEVIYTGPTKPDAAEQVKMIEDLINQGVDAICVAPNDAAALTNVLKKAKESGILVLDWDTPADPNLVNASVHQINDKDLGEAMVDIMVREMGTEEGDYAIITGGLSAANLNTWIDFGQEYAKTKYPKLNLVTDKQPSDEKQQEAMKKAIELMTAYPTIKGFIGYSTPAPLGIAQGMREMGLQDSVAVVGTAVKEDCAEYLSDGSLDVGVLWDPARLGYLTIATAKHLLEGGDLASLKVDGYPDMTIDGINVYMGKPDEYTK